MVLCRAFRNSGIPCTFDAKKGDLCKLHFNSKAICPIDWEMKQFDLKRKNIDLAAASFTMTPLTFADTIYREKQKIKKEKKIERVRQRMRDNEDYNNFVNHYYVGQYERPRDDEYDGVPEFHLDNQNVHRAETVALVKSTIAKLMALKDLEPTDKTFNWSAEVLSATPTDIIMKCSITPAAGVLLVQKYASAEPIYDMVPGIYGKVLDRVWQFVKTSDDSDNLRKILRTELEDNVGMCAQGNLSRICNVLSGYLEGLSTPPIAEILGDLLPPLASIVSLDARYTAAVEILRTHNVPEDKWNDWLEPLEVDRFPPPFTIATGDGRF